MSTEHEVDKCYEPEPFRWWQAEEKMMEHEAEMFNEPKGQPILGPFMESEPGKRDGWAYLNPPSEGVYRWPVGHPQPACVQFHDPAKPLIDAIYLHGTFRADDSAFDAGMSYKDAEEIRATVKRSMEEMSARWTGSVIDPAPSDGVEDKSMNGEEALIAMAWHAFQRGFVAGSVATAVVGLGLAVLGRRYDALR